MVNPELNILFRDLLASNVGSGYGVSVVAAAADLWVIEVELRFISGRTYCCAEPGCHLPTDERQERLRRLAAERGIRLPEALTVRWHCHVERGATLESDTQAGSPVDSDAYDFKVTYGTVT